MNKEFFERLQYIQYIYAVDIMYIYTL